MLRRLPIGPSVRLRMRFDQTPGAAVRCRALPDSMRPKALHESFTPFPLPRYDEDLGYGPLRLRDVPDVARAEKRQRRRHTPAAMALAEVLEEECTGVPHAQLQGTEETQLQGTEETQLQGTEETQLQETELSGYTVAPEYPLIDRLYCVRSLADLLSQFSARPSTEARCAALADMASTLSLRTDAELERMFDEIGCLFEPDGRGLNFLVTKVVKYGRPYYVTSSLVLAYKGLVDAASSLLVEEQPWRLSQCPALVVRLLHFMALIKVFEPNKWFTASSHAPSNRADYSHPRGTNRTTAFWCTGEALFDHILALICADESPLLAECSAAQLVDLLRGLAAVVPDARVPGDAFGAITKEFLHCVQCAPQVDMALVEHMYFTTVMCDAPCDVLLRMLLQPSSESGGTRGPDFFAAVARSRDAAAHHTALAFLEVSLRAAVSCDDNGAAMAALLESGGELLMSLRAKEEAVAFAARNAFDDGTLRCIPHFAEVADRLCLQRRAAAAENDSITSADMGQSVMALRDVQAQLLTASLPRDMSINMHSNMNTDMHSASLLCGGKAPVRTILSSLPRLAGMGTVFLLHSSLLAGSVDELIAAVRRLTSGKDALVVTTSCLRAISVRAATSVKPRERDACARALEIVSYEMLMGRATLVPFSEELQLHDAGVCCDEDLMLWTIAALFARELPLVRVLTLMGKDAIARTPQRFLKGSHSVMHSPRALYDKDAPLLAALHSKELRLATRHAQLRTAVRDRKCTLYTYNPVRSRFVYRRDRALFDKYHTHARNLAPGFSRGALQHDWRGLGVYTPDHPQVPYQVSSESA